MAKNDNYGLFKKIETRKNALRFIRDVSIWLFILALAQFAFAISVNPQSIIDAIILGLCGFFLIKSRSKAAAITYFAFTIITIIFVFAKKFGADWGTDGWLPLILFNFFISAKTVDTVFKLNKEFATSAVENNATNT